MIKNLVIDNIALISHLEIDFQEGLTVLSGETGSGKSIIIDSLAFVLGDRADKTLIKCGENAAEVSALFEVDSSCPVIGKLDEYGYGSDTEILLNRKMSLSGKNEIRIQGKTATLAILKEVCAELVDIFGQGQHLALLNEKNQLGVLDAFCDFKNCDVELKDVWNVRLSAINKELKSYGGSDAERERLLDILKFQIDEIKNAELDVEEEEQLLAAHRRMVNAEKISFALNAATDNLSGDQGAINKLSQACSALKGLANLEDAASELQDRLQSARLEVEDVCSELYGLVEQTAFSPSEADRMEARLEHIKQIKRKYGGSITECLKFLQDAELQYANLNNAAVRIEELNSKKRAVLNAMYQLSCKMSAERKRVAEDLSGRIMRELNDLGMSGTKLVVQFNDEVDFDGYTKSPSSNGFDKVEFLMSANVGEPLKPLAKVISGGEMSRFMLAVKNITALAERIPTMVFDEIDTGISGNMAQMVANKLANVSHSKREGYQCIVITHLPQIVAMADVNLYINKYERDGKTYTSVKPLCDDDSRAAEVARLMGGVGAHAVVNAKELLDWSLRYKKSLDL